MYQHKLTTLKNGLRLMTIPMPQVESMTVMVGVGAGSRHEAKRVSGLSHFLEHMAFKGTKKRPSALQIFTDVDAVGGQFNAFTGKEITGFYIKLAVKHKELAFDILSDMLLNSLYKIEEIERERGVIIEEINMYGDTPRRKVAENFIRLLYGDNSMGWSTAGEKKGVRQIKREDLLKHINQLYYPKNMVVTVAGKLKEAELNKLTKKHFNQLGKKGRKQTKGIKLFQKKSKVNIVFKKTEQTHFVLGVPGYWYSHPDRFVISVLTTILGGGMSSRLWIQIREKRGLAYYVRGTSGYYTDSGFFLARAGVKLKKIDEAIKVCLDEFQRISIEKVEDKELTKTKEMLKGNLILSLEDSMNVAERYTNSLLLEKKVRAPEETMKLIDKVTAEDIQRVAKNVFKPEKLNLAVIGPYKDEKRFKKLL